MLRVLGPLEVSTETGRVPLGGAKVRTLLAALAIGRGATQSADVLIDALWGEAPPASAAKLLHVYVSQLRKPLPPDIRIQTTEAGYALEVTGETDADRFERLLAEGRAALRASNPALAGSLFTRSLAQWRGPAYEDVRYEPFARIEIERLDRLRHLALDGRIDADLRLGRHAEILGELRGRLAEDPTDERLASWTMIAAYRTSGATEALAIFETVRATLQDDLGADPGPDLTSLRDRIEQGDTTLGWDEAPGLHAAGFRLPVAPNPLIGRSRELAELRALLERPDVRLVSMTGAGGTGKSRLALELARDVASRFANGAAFVEFAPLDDAALVPATIARAIGVEPGVDPGTALLEAVADREMLLVLDNLEHLRASVPDITRLLAAAPRLVVVATTRVVLHASGEHVYPVPPLAETDAIRLFTERARALDPTFVLGARTEPTVAAICRRLDGLPLSIELAATRARVLGLDALDARLVSRLSVLSGGPRDLPARQQALRETLDWSAALLEPRHQAALAALAVFPGTWSLDAALAVAEADEATIAELLDHSLVQSIPSEAEPRFRMLETVREYAGERLGSRRDAVEDAVADWVVDLLRSLGFEPPGPPPTPAFDRIEREADTIRLAMRRTAKDPEPTRELAIAAWTWRLWFMRGDVAEARSVYSDILARRGIVATADGVRTAVAAAEFAWGMGDDAWADATAVDTIEVARSINEFGYVAHGYGTRGSIAMVRGDLDAAAQYYSEGLAIANSADLEVLAHILEFNLAEVDLLAGHSELARDRFLALRDVIVEKGPSESSGHTSLNLGRIELTAGDLAAAESHFREALESFRSVSFHSQVAHAEAGIAAVEARTGRADAAARRLGQAARRLGETRSRADEYDLAASAAVATREALGDARFEQLFAEGAGGEMADPWSALSPPSR